MKIIEIYEPPLCCPTGVCGPAPDPDLAALQEMILMLKKDGHQPTTHAVHEQSYRQGNP
jgi:hypothetical protein